MKKSRESSHYFSRQYPRRRQIRLPARLQISGTMTMPQGSSRWEHTMGAALCSGHGRRRLHARQRQTPRSAGETSRAVFSSAPIAVFLIQKEKILEIVLFPFIGTNLSPPCEGAEVSAPSFFLPSYAGHGMTSLSGGSSFGCFSSGCMALSTVPMSR